MEQNPFIISGYSGAQYFCDRNKETARLINAIENGRYSTIISPRRMGKSGLIWHSFSKLNRKDFVPVYIDILSTSSLSEFTALFIRKTIEALLKSNITLKKIAQQLSALRLRFSLNPVSGEPSVSIDFNSNTDAEQSLSKLISYMIDSKYHFVIAIDEFQKISSYPGKNIEAYIRSVVQDVPNLTVIFSGSRRHMLTEMFSSPQRPLFGMTEILELDKISIKAYSDFIDTKFKNGGKEISNEIISAILEETGRHTYYVQYLCNRFYSLDSHSIESLYILLDTICNENVSVYANYLNVLSNSQYRVLRALCLNGGSSSPQSKEFIAEYGLGASSTVHQSLNSLITKEFIYKEKDVFYPFDPFMARWLRNIS
jgi:hypothetical protein